ncbi:MAG: glycosyltransferase [Candidatus Kerfeldbacteria bacterium CG08_land_8_20_14_0_20_40_16]|uniref:Glycosyltransferase n=1 Tax=Candidatus Kerfeldbacteria bacterium CG08_land_8_20_14_0_20_40_16 TaxID=2014244 RepID=A0A2H0YVH8_9BACT|nr:MAG: glycosyltransferase [Candidatus Kerfeldbacteria bacterium CG08_land_8_20_14_0_20_40_16]
MDKERKIKYSVIVPAYNEVNAVAPLHHEIKAVMDSLNESYEIIFIDDGSNDGTFEELVKLSPIKIIKFRKNFGQTSALDAGFKQAQGEIFITLDGDGQNDPADIPKLLEELNNGCDLVSGWRYDRKDSVEKRFISRGADFMRKFFINDQIHDSGCTLKVYKHECLENLNLYGEMHRFITGIVRWQGFEISEVKVNHRPRTTGETKYNWKRIVKGLIDMISVWFWRKYSSRPLHLFGGLGLLISSIGFLLGLYLIVFRLLGRISLQNRIWPLVAVFMVLVGLQLFISGLLADIAVKTYYNNRRTAYNIEKIVEKNEE